MYIFFICCQNHPHLRVHLGTSLRKDLGWLRPLAPEIAGFFGNAEDWSRCHSYLLVIVLVNVHKGYRASGGVAATAEPNN